MTKRGKHEGSINKRADGRWEARVTLETGKRKSYYATTRKAVAERLRDALHDQAKGLPLVAEKQTVAEYLTRWLLTSATRTDPSTHRRYRDQVERIIIPALGNTLLARLGQQQIQDLYDARSAQGVSPATVRLLHAVLHRALKDAVRKELIATNKSELVTLPRQAENEIQPFSEEQANQFLDAVAGHPYEALFVLAITTGMRQGELLGLRWEAVDLEKGEVHVEQAVQETHGEGRKRAYHLAAPKTGKRPPIALSQLALAALHAHRARQQSAHMSSGLRPAAGLVFPDELGELLRPRMIYYRFKKVLVAAGLPDRRFHDLRHTAATILLARGLNVKQISEMLGHADITMTLRIYGHVLPHMHEAAAKMMDVVFARRA